MSNTSKENKQNKNERKWIHLLCFCENYVRLCIFCHKERDENSMAMGCDDRSDKIKGAAMTFVFPLNGRNPYERFDNMSN